MTGSPDRYIASPLSSGLENHHRPRLIEHSKEQVPLPPAEGEGELTPRIGATARCTVSLLRFALLAVVAVGLLSDGSIRLFCSRAKPLGAAPASEAEIILFVECITSNYADPVAPKRSDPPTRASAPAGGRGGRGTPASLRRENFTVCGTRGTARNQPRARSYLVASSIRPSAVFRNLPRFPAPHFSRACTIIDTYEGREMLAGSPL
jgi:hypothetical protein